MGQYYMIVNVNKNQVLFPHDFDCGNKLMEWAYIDNYLTNALMHLMGSIWAGDRVYVVGDYADLKCDPDAVWVPALKEVYEMFSLDKIKKDLFDYAEDNFDRIAPAEDIQKTFTRTLPKKDNDRFAIPEVSIKSSKSRFIYNHVRKTYIDLAHCPIEGSWESNGVIGLIKIHPLPLLLAMGNGQGGGDFWNDPHGYVGSWCSDIRDIRVSSIRLPGTEDYQEFRPDFTEQEGEPIPWDKEKEFLEKVTAAYRHTKRKTTSKL